MEIFTNILISLGMALVTTILVVLPAMGLSHRGISRRAIIIEIATFFVLFSILSFVFGKEFNNLLLSLWN